MRNTRRSIAVLDTNILISGVLTATGSCGLILSLLRERVFQAQVSAYLLQEYERVLARPYAANTLAQLGESESDFVRNLFRDASIVHPDPPEDIHVRDPKDVLVLATALYGPADFLVSGDKDLLALTGDPELGKLRIVDPPMFLEILGSID